MLARLRADHQRACVQSLRMLAVPIILENTEPRVDCSQHFNASSAILQSLCRLQTQNPQQQMTRNLSEQMTIDYAYMRMYTNASVQQPLDAACV